MIELVAALAGLCLYGVARRSADSRLQSALSDFQTRARALESYYTRAMREQSEGRFSGKHPIHLPADGLTLWAAGKYRNTATARLLHDIKAGGVERKRRRVMVEQLAGELVAALDIIRPPFNLVTSAPSTPSNQARRGYDHVREMAELVAAACGVRYVPLLLKSDGAYSQVMVRKRAARLENVRRSITVRQQISAFRVLIVDDVSTTGATLEACANALRNAGAADVVAMVLASDRRGA